MAGLKALKFGSDGELWGVFTRGETSIQMENEVKKNTARLRKEVLRNLIKDGASILKDWTRNNGLKS